MKEFSTYLENADAEKVTPSFVTAKALLEKAEKRLEYVRVQKLTEENAPFIFEDVYECMREAAQSLMALKGYKPLSHTVVVPFLKEFHNLPERYLAMFERYRKMRNNAIYGAAYVTLEECSEALDFAKEFNLKIKEIFMKE